MKHLLTALSLLTLCLVAGGTFNSPDDISTNQYFTFQATPPNLPSPKDWNILWGVFAVVGLCLFLVIVFVLKFSNSRKLNSSSAIKRSAGPRSYEILLMEYCLELLKKRRRSDMDNAWLWEINLKVG